MCAFTVQVLGMSYSSYSLYLIVEAWSLTSRLWSSTEIWVGRSQEMLDLAIKYNKAVQEEDQLSPEKLAIVNVGRQDAKKHLEEHVSNLMSSNIVQTLGTMLDTVVF